MNFIHPSAVRMLPGRAKCSIAAVYSMHLADARRTQSGWTERPQSHLAAYLGCDVRTIRRHEASLAKAGLVTVEWHGRANRRRLRPNELKSGKVNRGESADNSVRTVRTELSALSGASPIYSSSRRILSEEGRAPRASEGPPAAAERGAPLRKKTAAPNQGLIDSKLGPALDRLFRTCQVHRRAWPEVAELARELADLRGVAFAVSRLTWATDKNATLRPEKRGAMTIGLLRSMVSKVAEKGGARTHSVAR